MRLLHLKMRSNASLVHLYSAGIILILTSVLTSHEQQSSMQKSNETGILMGLTPDGFFPHPCIPENFPWTPCSGLLKFSRLQHNCKNGVFTMGNKYFTHISDVWTLSNP